MSSLLSYLHEKRMVKCGAKTFMKSSNQNKMMREVWMDLMVNVFIAWLWCPNLILQSLQMTWSILTPESSKIHVNPDDLKPLHVNTLIICLTTLICYMILCFVTSNICFVTSSLCFTSSIFLHWEEEKYMFRSFDVFNCLT